MYDKKLREVRSQRPALRLSNRNSSLTITLNVKLYMIVPASLFGPIFVHDVQCGMAARQPLKNIELVKVICNHGHGRKKLTIKLELDQYHRSILKLQVGELCCVLRLELKQPEPSAHSIPHLRFQYISVEDLASTQALSWRTFGSSVESWRLLAAADRGSTSHTRRSFRSLRELGLLFAPVTTFLIPSNSPCGTVFGNVFLQSRCKRS